jgi:hypothetical protein
VPAREIAGLVALASLRQCMPSPSAGGVPRPLCAHTATTKTSISDTILRVVSREFMLT